MADLYPTPTRLALLDAVADGHVYRDRDEQDWLVYGWPVMDKVTARVGEMRAAGWVELAPTSIRNWVGRWRLTDAGRAVLDANGGDQS